MFAENRKQVLDALQEHSQKEPQLAALRDIVEIAMMPPKDARNGKDNRRMNVDQVERLVMTLEAKFKAAINLLPARHVKAERIEAALPSEKSVIMQILGPNGNVNERHAWTVPAGARLAFQVGEPQPEDSRA